MKKVGAVFTQPFSQNTEMELKEIKLWGHRFQFQRIILQKPRWQCQQERRAASSNTPTFSLWRYAGRCRCSNWCCRLCQHPPMWFLQITLPFQQPDNVPWKATEDGTNVWACATSTADPAGVPTPAFSLAQLWSLQPSWKWTSRWKIPPLCNSAFQVNKSPVFKKKLPWSSLGFWSTPKVKWRLFRNLKEGWDTLVGIALGAEVEWKFKPKPGWAHSTRSVCICLCSFNNRGHQSLDQQVYGMKK